MTDVGLILIVILVLVVIWRGPKTLPLIGRALGQGVREARHEIDEMRSEEDAKQSPADQAQKGG